MLAAADSILSAAGIVVAIILGVIGAASLAWTYFRAGAGRSIISQQDAAINALKTFADEQVRQNDDLKAQVGQLKTEHDRMNEELKTLRELVTQAAKVDSLIILVQDGFQQLGVNVKVIK